jgi:hypothetical protein
VPWWVWALVLWAVLGAALGMSVGKVVKAADRRELRGQVLVRDQDAEVPPQRRRAS